VFVSATLSDEVDGRVAVSWAVNGADSSDIVEFDVYTDRNIQGKLLEITQAQIDGSLREATIDVTAGYEYQFRVRSKNALFGGEVATSSSIRVLCPSGTADSDDSGAPPPLRAFLDQLNIFYQSHHSLLYNHAHLSHC
jgi:hypothetical protein